MSERLAIVRPQDTRPWRTVAREALSGSPDPDPATTPDLTAHVVFSSLTGFEAFPTEAAALTAARKIASSNIGALVTVFRATVEIRAVLELQEKAL